MLDEELLHAYRRYLETDAALAAAGQAADARLRAEAAAARLRYHNYFEAFLQGISSRPKSDSHRAM